MCKVHWNDVCSYTTPRLARIRDWRLGAINTALMLGIVSRPARGRGGGGGGGPPAPTPPPPPAGCQFSYVVVYSVVFLQRYRVKALDLVGSTRLQLRPPAAAFSIAAPNTTFCGSGPSIYPGPAGIPFSRFPCRYYDAYDTVDPGLEPAAMFVSTRITETNQSLPDGCQDQPVYTCQYASQASTTYFIADVVRALGYGVMRAEVVRALG
jgi:hypothetical protein